MDIHDPNLGGMRNELGDAHGRGVIPPAISGNIAELEINTASTLSTVIIRRYSQLKENRHGKN